jgi:hypothetical protein
LCASFAYRDKKVVGVFVRFCVRRFMTHISNLGAPYKRYTVKARNTPSGTIMIRFFGWI